MIIRVPTSDEHISNFQRVLKKLRLIPEGEDLLLNFIFSQIGREYDEQELAGKIVKVVLGAPNRDPG